MIGMFLLSVTLIVAIQQEHPCSQNEMVTENTHRNHPHELFVGSDPGGVYLSLETSMSESDFFNQGGHLNSGQRGIETFVSAFSAGPFDSLFNVIGSKDTIYHGNTGIQSHGSNSL